MTSLVGQNLSVDVLYYRQQQSKVVRFGFDTSWPREVRIRYTEPICNYFDMLGA
jgi:hypothetical protein